MEIDEAKKIKHKAERIIREKGVPSSLQWLIDQNPNNFVSLEVSSPEGELEGKKIDKSVCFSHRENNYGLYYLGGHSVYTPDGGAFMGTFKLFFNEKLVLETSYSKIPPKSEEDFPTTEINYSAFSLIKLKLTKWVEEIPTIVMKEKDLIEKRNLKIKFEKDKKEAKKIDEDFDLGDYE